MTRMKSATLCAALFAAGLGFIAGIGPALGAGAQKYASGLTPLLDGPSGNEIGSIGPGAAVSVIGQSGSASHITVTGWAQQGAGTIAYAAPPDRHIAVLSGFTGHAAPGATQTVGGTVYQSMTVSGWVPTSALVDNVQTVWSNAATFYSQTCAACHALPAANSYPASQWPALVRAQTANAGLDPAQAALITTYLQVQSGH
jgi:trimethylamine-N-oxide reductase (cytochrome c), cytochrome c-type subunit TorC